MTKKVLTVDDSRTVRMIVARYIKPFGVEVVEAENGATGLSAAQSERPDIILLDYNMPVKDGYQTLVELKAHPDLKGIPVIMLTTETVKETVVKLIKLGLKDYLSKPFTRDVLLQKLNPILGLYSGDVPPSDSELSRGGSAGSAARDSAREIVLIVDDKENVLRLLRGHLGDRFNVLTAASGQAALRAIETYSVDWLFLDLDLPDMDALQVYETYKQGRKDFIPKRVIGMALRTAYREIAEARNRGIVDFLNKPFTREDVLKRVGGSGPKNAAPAEVRTEEGFLTNHGDVRVLTCLEQDHPRFADFSEALTQDVLREICDMADEGLDRLVIHMSGSVISNFSLSKQFLTLLNRIDTLALSLRLVAETDKLRAWLNHYKETESIPAFGSLDAALNSFRPLAEDETGWQGAAAER